MWLISLKPLYLSRFGGRRRRAHVGFTVIEVLVFSVILLLLMGSIVVVLQNGLRYLRLGAAYQDAHRETMVGMHLMVEGMRRGTAFHRSPDLVGGSNFIMFMSPERDTLDEVWTYKGSSTELQYYHWLCYYLDTAKGEVVEAKLPIKGAPVTTLDAPAFPALSDFQPPKNDQLRPIARGATRLQFQPGDSTQQVRIVLDCSVSTGTDKQTTVTSQSRVTMPNR